ncbi:MAG TPA: DUF2946 family protein [Rhodoblastus sp.]|nr:DUF2946 family protein [Rhodoblastus sp.]
MTTSRRDRTYDLAIDHARGRARREFMAMVGALVVLFNLLAAGALGASTRAAGSMMLANLSGEEIVICSGGGMIVVDRHGQPVENQDGATHRALCPFCAPLMQGHAKAPDPMALANAPDHPLFVALRAAAFARPVPPRAPGAAQPRAPPVG